MNQAMDKADLGEMLLFAKQYQEMGFTKIQMETEHAVEILERLLFGEAAQ